MTPEKRRRDSAADQVAYAAVRLSEGLTAVRTRTARLEERLRTAAREGMPCDEAEAMTKDLGLDVAFMVRRVYTELMDEEFEVTGRDTVMWCLRHRRQVTWLPAPGWWIHVKDRMPLDARDGHPGDPRGCLAMWAADAPIEIRRREPGSCRG